jgi:hypothetical protein
MSKYNAPTTVEAQLASVSRKTRDRSRSKTRPIPYGEEAIERYRKIVEQRRAQHKREYQRKKADLEVELKKAEAGLPYQIPEFFVKRQQRSAALYQNKIKPQIEAKKALERQWEAESQAAKEAWMKQHSQQEGVKV